MIAVPSEAERMLRLQRKKEHLLSLSPHALRLSAALQNDRPEVWAEYRETVKAEGVIRGAVSDVIREKSRELFPGRKLVDLNDIMLRMNQIVAAEFGRDQI